MRLAYGLGAGPFGIKDNGLSYLLLIFYNQALGLPAATVGLIIMVALIVDALTDPLIGHLSDRTRSRLGRRHPWMLGAILPTAAAVALLWNPPAGLGEEGLALWCLVLTLAVRLFAGAFEVPNAAMVAELARDYHLRTRMLALRQLSGWSFGILAGMSAFGIFLAERPGGGGVSDPAGYGAYGLAAAAAMALLMALSSLGTLRPLAEVAPPAPAAGRGAAGPALAALARNRPFLVVLGAGLFTAMTSGLSAALNVYLNTYLWGLSPARISLLVSSAFFGALLAAALAPALARRLEKRGGALALLGLVAVAVPAPPLLWLGGLMPTGRPDLLLGLLYAATIVQVTAAVGAAILAGSMLADTVEVTELASGRRAEGLTFAAYGFTNKAVSGVGVFASGIVLSIAGLSDQTRPGAVPEPVLVRLVLLYAGLVVVLVGTAALLLARYPITAAAHRRTLAALGR